MLLNVAAPVFQVFEVYEIQTDKRKQISADELMICVGAIVHEERQETASSSTTNKRIGS